MAIPSSPASRGASHSLGAPILTLAIAALLGAPSPARAQSVQGQVVDASTKRPIGGARVVLVSDSGVAAARTLSDSATGVFYLDAPTRGHYRVEIVVGYGGLVVSPPFALDSNQVIERVYSVSELPQAMRDARLAPDVTHEAKMLPGQAPPRYPDRARSRGEEGVVRAVVVVDTAGRPDMSTFLLLESPDAEFSEAVRDAAQGWRFSPADLDGRRVAQVKRISVDFGLGNAPSRLRADEADGMLIRGFTRTERVRMP